MAVSAPQTTEASPLSRKEFSMVPRAFWDICKRKHVCHAARGVWCYLNDNCMREQGMFVRYSQRTLCKQEHLDLDRKTLTRYLQELEAAGLLRIERRKRSTRIFVTDLWQLNAAYTTTQAAERAARKTAMQTGVFLEPPPASPSPASPTHTGSSLPQSGPFSPPPGDSFCPETGGGKGPDGSKKGPTIGGEKGPQNKKDQQEESLQEEMIRSDHDPLPLSLAEKAQRLIMLAHGPLPSLEASYDHLKRREQALAEEQAAAFALAEHPLIAPMDDQTFVALLSHTNSPACSWYQRFHEKYPTTPVQLKHLVQTNFVKERLSELATLAREAEAACELASLAEQSQRSIQAFHERYQAPTSTKTEDVPPPQEQTNEEPDTEPLMSQEEEGGPGEPEPDYSDVEGMLPTLAVRVLATIRTHNPEWQPVMRRAAENTHVIEVLVEGNAYYLPSWEHYQGLRQQGGFPLLDSLITRERSHDDRPTREEQKLHRQDYLAKCRALKAQREGCAL